MCHGSLLNLRDNNEERRKKPKQGGGRTPGPGSSLAPLQVFQIDFHHPLEHLSRFGIFGKSDVL
jgi:hypothetical protein